MDQIYQRIRAHHVYYQGISWILELIFPPGGKDTVYRAFNDTVGSTILPRVEDVQIIHYDEQFPRKGRNQRYCLTLLNGSGRVIAEELHSKKDPSTVKAFLGRHLDPNKPVFVVTDLYPSYPEVFMELFGGNLIHGLCLLHLNKRIFQDFPGKPCIEELHTMYRLLSIFYNREQELEVLGGGSGGEGARAEAGW